MVLFKRKHVQFLPRPTIEDEDADCWIIPETQEVFLSYESYLQRMDWYKSRKFICEISGHSGLSFFDALKSEAQGAKDVDNQFPDALKEPVLRRVQFSTVSRIDNLVDQVFEDFKNDFYPGESVTVLTEENARENGVVRDKAKFPEIRNQDGVVTREAFSRYVVSLADRPSVEMLVDDHNVSRDRKVFTKQMLRSFIKNTVHREAWNGAPWLVKQHYADWYRIDSNVPLHLQYGNKQAEKKEKKKIEQEQDNLFNVWQPNKLPELKPAPKGRKGQTPTVQNDVAPPGYYEEYHRALQADPSFAQNNWNQPFPPGYDSYPVGNGHYMLPNGHMGHMPPPTVPKQMVKLPPPSPPIKYPIEDMDIAPTRDTDSRPLLKFATNSQSSEKTSETDIISGLEENTVGMLLETWNTLNVYCQVLHLDSFTFDDFVDAMQFPSAELECELLVEIHCALLKRLVNSENEQNGAIQISLPDLPELEDSEEEEEEEEETRLPTPTPEPDVPARRTRSSLNKMQLAEEEKKQEKSPTPEATSLHKADEMFQDNYGWIERLRKRDFRHGGWQLILVGLLHQLAGRERLKESCDRILMHLAPLNAEPTMETVVVQYSSMDINLRTSALQIVCQIFLETKAVKNFLEEMSNMMTQLRKVKIEHQRARKEAIARLKVLHEERRQLAPQEKSPSPIPELEDTMEIDKVENGDVEIADSDDERPVTSRSLRRGQDRAAERKRKREAEQERKQKAAEEKQNKGSKEYQKVLKAIEREREKIEEAEEQIEIVDGDLREADCPRTRVLGKDRFCNRYWWFERNAMPYGGLPDSSTAEADYANGRLWVQGPDDMERIGYIDVPEDAKNNYFRAFQMTPAERKVMEEGATNLYTAYQWGFYDASQDIDSLIAWLDIRGIRELKLKKELTLQKELICKYMENRTAWLTRQETDEEPTTRMSTRTKTYVSENAPRCLRWHNTSAVIQNGHRHIDPPPKPKGRTKKAELPKARDSPVLAVVNRQGKPVTRQGIRYAF